MKVLVSLMMSKFILSCLTGLFCMVSLVRLGASWTSCGFVQAEGTDGIVVNCSIIIRALPLLFIIYLISRNS